MDAGTKLLVYILQLCGTVVLSPIFWVLAGIVGYQYARMSRLKTQLFGVSDLSVIKVTLNSILFGIIGGVIGSLLMVLFGVTISGYGLFFVFMLAVILMLYHPRFLCFAYAGGGISLFSLAFGFPALNVPHLMALIAILHVIESILIRLSGDRGALPVYTYNAAGQGVGGFNLQKFWPVPIVVMSIISRETGGSSGIDMPAWWPLLNPGLLDSSLQMYGLLPAAVGLGYGELALTGSPQQRRRLSARTLGGYSLILLTLAVLASYYPLLSWAAALFAPLGHEAVIRRSLRQELAGPAKYVLSSRGLRLLDVLHNSPAYRAGLRSGDVISEVAGVPTRSRQALFEAFKTASLPVEVKYWRSDKPPGRDFTEQLQQLTMEPVEPERLGLILVPGYGGERYLEFRTSGSLRRWWENLRSKR